MWAAPAHASPLSSCKSIYSYLFKPELFHSRRQLDSLAASLTEKSLSALSAGSEVAPDSALALVRLSDGSYLRGNVGTIRMAEDFHLISVKDGKTVHLIDSSSGAKVFLASPEQEKLVLGYKVKWPDKSLVQVDTGRLKNLVCKDLPLKGPEYQRRKELIHPYLTVERKRRLLKRLNKTCPSFGMGMQLGMGVWAISSMPRQLGYLQDNYLLQHASNFYLTPLLMGIVHDCLSTALPNQRHLFLGAAVATGVTAQVVEEVNIEDVPLFKTIGNHNRKETDWEDFQAGMAGLSAYVAASLVLDQIYDLNLQKFCQ